MEVGQRPSPVSMAWLNAARQTLIEGGTRSGRDVVDSLVPLLSDWDIIYLRSKIANLRIGSNTFAKFIDLPLDCVYLILPYLTIRDFLRMRLVSQEWNRVLTQPELLVALCRVYYPGLLAPGANHVNGIKRKFLDIARQYSRKSPDTCGKMFVPWDIVGHTAVPNSPSTLRPNPYSQSQIGPRGRYLRSQTYESVYADGKLVLFAHKNFMLVDDLTKGTRTRLAIGDDPRVARKNLKVEAITGRILVLSSLPGPSLAALAGPSSSSSSSASEAAKRRTLHIYHFDRQIWRDVILPARLAECFAYDERFVATFHSKNAMLWTWSKGLVELPIDHPKFNAAPLGSENLYSNVAGVLIHPFDPHTIFLTWVYVYRGVNIGENLYSVVVVKYDYQGGNVPWLPTKDYRYSIKHPIPKAKPANHCFGGHADPISICFSRRFSRSSSQGMFLVGLFWLASFLNEQYNDGMCDCVRPEWDKECLRALSFNVVTETFSEHRYYGFKKTWAVNIRTILRKGRGVTDQGTFDHVQIWNGELFHMYQRILDSGMAPVVESIRGRGRGGFATATLSGDSDRETFDHMSNQLAVAEGPYQLFLDQDFLVLAGRHGYTVWRWDKRQPDNGEQWLSTKDCIMPNMRTFDAGLEEDYQMELIPPFHDARCELYDLMINLYHAPRDSDIYPEFES